MNGSVRTREAPAEADSIRDNKLDLVERLADDLAHEIKNPLHAMVINLEVLRRKLARLSPAPEEDLNRYTAVLDTELERVSQRIDLLLRMVRPSRGNEEPGVLSDVLEELRDLIDLECRQNKVRFEMEIPSVIPRPALPPSTSRQLLLSLMLSCLEVAEPGDTLRVSAESDGRELTLLIALDSSGAADLSADIYAPVAAALAVQLGGALDTLPGATGYQLTFPLTS